MVIFSEQLENLLASLYSLMDESENIRRLPSERKEKIKEKYRLAGIDSIKKGILMLEKDISDRQALENAAKESLLKNSEKLREFRLLSEREHKHSEKLAEEMIQAVAPSPKKKRWFRTVLAIALSLVAVIAVLICFFMLK